MMVFGLILIGLAVLLSAGVAAGSGNRATLDVFGIGIDTRTSVAFFLGAAAGMALLVGLWLTKLGLARGYRRRREVRELRHQVQAAPAPLADLSSSSSSDAPENVAPSNDETAAKHLASTPDDTSEAPPAAREAAPREQTPDRRS